MPGSPSGSLAAVTGATGFAGRHLVGHLAAAGHRVRAVVREPAATGFPDGVEIAVADVTDPAALAAALDGAETVYHLAAKLHVNDPPPSAAAEYRSVNVGGTANVAAAAPQARLVLFSTVAVYGPGRGGEPFTEYSPPRPETLYATTKAAAEDEAAAHGNAVVLRPAAVYGPGMKGNYLRMLAAVRRGRFVLVDGGANRRTLVHVADLCRAAELAAAAPAGATYNVTDGEIHTVRAIAAAMAAAAGRRPPRLSVPAAPVRLALAAAHRLAGDRLPVGPEAVAKLTEDVAVDGSRLARATGYRPQVGLAAGWASVTAG